MHRLMTRGNPEGLAGGPGVWEGVGNRVRLDHGQDNIGINPGPGWTAEHISRELMGGAGKELRPILGSFLKDGRGPPRSLPVKLRPGGLWEGFLGKWWQLGATFPSPSCSNPNQVF